MDNILAQRYGFYDFSNIVGFLDPMPSRDDWESILPKLQGEEWEIPAVHLLNFHYFIHQLHIVIARFAPPRAILHRRPFFISPCNLLIPFCKSQR
jgi:hypothetical protein